LARPTSSTATTAAGTHSSTLIACRTGPSRRSTAGTKYLPSSRSTSPEAMQTNLTAQQQFLFDAIDRNARAIALLGDNVFYFGELGMQESETAKLMTGLLEKAGFRVERGISGFPTGFCASWGAGHPVVAIHTEYDSCPDNSQAPGIPRQTFIVEGAPGHC